MNGKKEGAAWSGIESGAEGRASQNESEEGKRPTGRGDEGLRRNIVGLKCSE